jgi:hypothetical protein
MRKIYLFFFLICLGSVDAQILNADGFGRPVDSTHFISGTVDFGMTLNKQSNLILSFDGRADVSYWHLNNVLISTNNYQLFRTGSLNLVNGGFSHLRFRMRQNKILQPEFFAQYQLDNIRGMKERLLAGSNLRIRIKEGVNTSLFFGIGAMYEYEKWDYSGIRPDATPRTDTVRNQFIKMNTYLSYRQKINDFANFNVIFYFQTRPDSYFKVPRISSDARLSFKINKFISYAVSYNIFFDAAPPVPIFKWYYSVVNRLIFTF